MIPPHLQKQIEELATDWCIDKGVYNKEHFAFQAGAAQMYELMQPLIEALIDCKNSLRKTNNSKVDDIDFIWVTIMDALTQVEALLSSEGK